MNRSGAFGAVQYSSMAAAHAEVRSRARGKGHRAPARMMFERFTEKAIKVVMLAQEEARRLGEFYPAPVLLSSDRVAIWKLAVGSAMCKRWS